MLFGSYFQPDLIHSAAAFRQYLPEYSVPKDIEFDSQYSTVRKDDVLRARVIEEKLKFE